MTATFIMALFTMAAALCAHFSYEPSVAEFVSFFLVSPPVPGLIFRAAQVPNKRVMAECEGDGGAGLRECESGSPGASPLLSSLSAPSILSFITVSRSSTFPSSSD